MRKVSINSFNRRIKKEIIFMVLSVALSVSLLIQPFAMTGAFVGSFVKEAYAADTISSYDTLVSNIKAKLVNRETSFVITYTGPTLNMKSADLFEKAIDDACADQVGGAPNEGDYLAFSISKNRVSATTTGNTITFNATVEYNDDAGKEAQVTAKINQLKSEWSIASMSELDKIKYIHDFVVKHITYDKTYSRHSAYDALIGQSSVCQGYALLTYRLCKTFGIEARIVSGKDLKQNRNHAWNIVKINGKYYNLDNTWDSTLAKGAEIRYDYFLVSDYDNEEHERDPEYMTSAFVNRYPVTTESYYFDEPMLNIAPQTYSFVTMDGSTVSNTNSVATVLVIGSPSDNNFVKQKQYTQNSDIKNNSSVRVAFIDIDAQTNPVFNYLSATGLNTGNTVSLPITILIDKNSSVQFAYIGELARAGKIIHDLNRFDGISISATPVVVYKGTNGTTGKTDSSGGSGTTSSSSSSKKTYVKKGYTYKTKKLIYKVTKSGANGCEVTVKKSVKTNIKKVSVPATVKIKKTTYKVVSISKNAFKNCKKLESVTVGKNIKSVKKGAFSGCKRIRYIRSYSPSAKVFNTLKKLLKH